VLLVLEGGWGRTASAEIILFTDPQSFFQSAKIESTETFDEIPSRTIIGVGSVALAGITYTSADALAQWYTFDSFVTPSPPNGLTQKNVIAPATLTFANGGNTGAIGFYLQPGSSFPGGDYRLDVVTTTGDILTVDTGIVTNTIFRGFVSVDGIREGIKSISITPLEIPGGISNFELDNVSRGAISAVPEPSSMTLARTGILILAVYMLSRRRAEPAGRASGRGALSRLATDPTY